MNSLSLSVVYFVVLLLCIFFSFIFSGAQAALLALSNVHLEALKSGFETKKNKKGKLLLQLLMRPNRLLCSFLLGNCMAKVGAVYIGASLYFNRESSLSSFELSDRLSVAFLLFMLVLVVGELCPRMWGNKYPIQFFSHFIGIFRFFYWLSQPIVQLMARCFAVLHAHIWAETQTLPFNEMSEAITSETNQSNESKQILKALIDATSTTVKDIAGPRMDISAINYNLNFDQLREAIVASGYSRIPVFKEKLDQITGILYIKDLLPYIHSKDQDFKWQQFMRDAYFVEEDKRINDLLSEFQQKKVHLAVVVNEYGETTGLISLEDILEEIFGEIVDESDIESDEILFTEEMTGVYLFEGKTPVIDFCKLMHLEPHYFDEHRGDSDSLAGVLLHERGDLFAVGDTISILDFDFEVVEIAKNRIVTIRVERS